MMFGRKQHEIRQAQNSTGFLFAELLWVRDRGPHGELKLEATVFAQRPERRKRVVVLYIRRVWFRSRRTRECNIQKSNQVREREVKLLRDDVRGDETEVALLPPKVVGALLVAVLQQCDWHERLPCEVAVVDGSNGRAFRLHFERKLFVAPLVGGTKLNLAVIEDSSQTKLQRYSQERTHVLDRRISAPVCAPGNVDVRNVERDCCSSFCDLTEVQRRFWRRMINQLSMRMANTVNEFRGGQARGNLFSLSTLTRLHRQCVSLPVRVGRERQAAIPHHIEFLSSTSGGDVEQIEDLLNVCVWPRFRVRIETKQDRQVLLEAFHLVHS
mmetsp:Transcript_11973/g.37262  ORF Transcript_11973/g.37262 Transcript_11973/m.37262 type:complete len:327 (+) Transcript_11973:443-1423(+)